MSTGEISSRAVGFVVGILFCAESGRSSAQELIFFREGDDITDFFGYSFCSIGDLDGRGARDILVGAPNSGCCVGKVGGYVRAFAGEDGGTLFTICSPDARDDSFGLVANARDLDRDGVDDFIVCAPNISCVYVFSGKDLRILFEHCERVDAGFGGPVAGGSDLSGDGVPDFIVSAASSQAGAYIGGAVYVFSGADGSVLYVLYGYEDQGRFGFELDLLEDVSGDGCAEILVGAPGANSSPGHVYLYSGNDGVLLYQVDGPDPGGLFGRSVANVLDADGDGFEDFVAGGMYVDNGGLKKCGMAVVFSGPTGAPLFTHYGTRSDDLFGYVVGGTGDVNGDGHSDYAVGAPWWNSGRVIVYSGLTGKLMVERFPVVDPFRLADFGLGTVGDLNHDGLSDVAAQGNDYSHQGSLHVYSGHELFLSTSASSFSSGQKMVLFVRGGPAQATLALFVVRIGDLPVSQLFSIAFLDTDGDFSQTFTVPAGLSGLTMTLQGFACGDPSHSRGVLESNPVVVEFL